MAFVCFRLVCQNSSSSSGGGRGVGGSAQQKRLSNKGFVYNEGFESFVYFLSTDYNEADAQSASDDPPL